MGPTDARPSAFRSIRDPAGDESRDDACRFGLLGHGHVRVRVAGDPDLDAVETLLDINARRCVLLREQSECLDVARTHDREVPAVESGDLDVSKSLCQRDHAGVGAASSKVVVLLNQFCGAQRSSAVRSRFSRYPVENDRKKSASTRWPASRASRKQVSTMTGPGTTRGRDADDKTDRHRSWF